MQNRDNFNTIKHRGIKTNNFEKCDKNILEFLKEITLTKAFNLMN